MTEFDFLCIKTYGFTYDFFNEFPFELTPRIIQEFAEQCRKGEIRTYSQRYCQEPEIIRASQKGLIDTLDNLVEQMITAAQKKDVFLVEQSLKKIYSYRK